MDYKEKKDLVEQILSERDSPSAAYGDPMRKPGPVRNVDILLMFGPGHGTKMELPASHNRSEVYWQESGSGMMLVSGPLSGDDYYNPRAGMPKMHRYKRFDEFVSGNMEECLLYTHADDCCEETMEEKPRAIPKQRPGVRRPKGLIW